MKRNNLTKVPIYGIIAVYKQSVKQTTRLSARPIFNFNLSNLSVYKLTTLYRNYLILGMYLLKLKASYKTPILYSRYL